MWSRFEKLKDNITQIASDVLESQDDDDELDAEGSLDDDSLDGHHNAPQSPASRHSASDDEDDKPELPPTEDELIYQLPDSEEAKSGEENVLISRKDLQETRNGHVDVVRELLEADDALVENTDTESEMVSEDHYVATNGFHIPEKEKLEVNSLNGKAANGFQKSAPLLSEVEVNGSEDTSNEQESHEGSSHKDSHESSPHEGSHGGSSHKDLLEGFFHEDSHEGSSLKESHEGSSLKESHEGSSHKDSHEGSPQKDLLEGFFHKDSHEGSSLKESHEGSSLKESHEGSSHKDSHEGSPQKDLLEGFFHKDSHEDSSLKESQALYEVSSDKELQASSALEEQVRSLSERLRASEDVCCSLQTKLDAVSLDRDTISKRLEGVLTEPETMSKKLEEALLERDSFSRKVVEVSFERDKAVQNLGRLRQNLLDMESSTSEKMDNDTILIGDLELRLKSAEEYTSQLQQALVKSQDDLAEANRNNVLRSMGTSEEMELLKLRLQACSDALESKDMELANLQSALGQYYAESDAQERLESELRAVRELNARLTRDLKIAEEAMDLKGKELEKVTQKLASSDALNVELKHTMHKLQQDVLKLRAALEQSITSLNRMSSDSDFYVDRRIVIKLLVTYFQRHHSKEVLDLMVRMLGFSEEDKKRVGMAQQNARGGGMVRSVFGVPGRIVGGILGSSDSETSPRAAPGENQSFADMWIDFLLKESQERERRERGEGGGNSATMSPGSSISRSMPSSPSGGSYHKPSSSFFGFPSSSHLPPKPSRVSSSTDLETILTGDTRDDAHS